VTKKVHKANVRDGDTQKIRADKGGSHRTEALEPREKMENKHFTSWCGLAKDANRREDILRSCGGKTGHGGERRKSVERMINNKHEGIKNDA